jgi:hypothetical protein
LVKGKLLDKLLFMNRFGVIFFILTVFGMTAASVWADPLEETTALLNDPVARAQLIQKDPQAKAADQRVTGLGLDQAGQDQVYKISGSITESLAASTGGDSEKMSEKVQEYLRDPASVEKDLTPEQRAQIHELSEEMPKN